MKSVTIVLLLALTGAAIAQVDIEKEADQIKKRLSIPVAQWDDELVITTFQRYLDLYLDFLWSKDTHQKIKSYLPVDRPHVKVAVSGELRTPYERHDEIMVPVEYLRYLTAIGSLVGHDVYVQDNAIDVRYPLLSAPYRSSAIIPLLHPIAPYVTDVGNFMSVQTYLMCPGEDKSCALVQGQAVMGAVLFAVLHELSHVVLHHSVEEGVNLNNEIAADKSAFHVLSLLADELQHFSPEIRKELRIAMRAVPPVVLEVESSREGDVGGFSMARKNALLTLLDKDTREALNVILEYKHSDANIQHVAIRWNEVPEMLLIDGIVVPVSDVADHVLSMNRSDHLIIALRKDAMASATVSFLPGSSPTQVQLTFAQFLPPDAAAIEQARSRRHWLEVLIRTTDSNLAPRNSAATMAHFEALHRLGLLSFIKVADWNLIPREDWGKVRVWQRQAEPLASWR